jgi:hypothetical protein
LESIRPETKKLNDRCILLTVRGDQLAHRIILANSWDSQKLCNFVNFGIHLQVKNCLLWHLFDYLREIFFMSRKEQVNLESAILDFEAQMFLTNYHTPTSEGLPFISSKKMKPKDKIFSHLHGYIMLSCVCNSNLS